MFKIGEFARLGQVSVRTLHHYAELGLLKPLKIDRFSGYRYYSAAQLPRLNRILALKDLGLSLEQVGRLLDEDLSPDRLKALLLQRQTEVRQQLQESELLLTRLAAWLSQLSESEAQPMHDYGIELKQVEPLLVASLRQTVPTYGTLHGPFGVLRSYLAEFGVTKQHPSLVLWHFSEAATAGEEQGYEVEVAEQLDAPLPSTDQIKVYRLPQIELAASVTYRGELHLAFQAYQALGAWVEEHGYQVCGPTRQIHHVFNPPEDPGTFLTEFQFPVEVADSSKEVLGSAKLLK